MKTTMRARPSSHTGCVTVELEVVLTIDVRDGQVVSVHHPSFEDVQATYDKQLAATEPTRGETD